MINYNNLILFFTDTYEWTNSWESPNNERRNWSNTRTSLSIYEGCGSACFWANWRSSSPSFHNPYKDWKGYDIIYKRVCSECIRWYHQRKSAVIILIRNKLSYRACILYPIPRIVSILILVSSFLRIFLIWVSIVRS